MGDRSGPQEQVAAEARGGMAARFSRGTLLKGSAALAGALGGSALGAARLLASADSGASPARDREILTLGLLIERLQAAFYADAVRAGHLSGEARQFAQVVGGQEQEHVKFVASAVGASAGKSPQFRFGDTTSDQAKFIDTAVTLEETGLRVYNGQAVNLTPTTLTAAARLVSVEARHAAWARALAGKDPAPAAVDVPLTVGQAKQILQPFIVQ